MHVPKEKRSKIDNKYEKCIFVGYKDKIKGYKIWNPVTRKIVYNQDVVFREGKSTSRNEDESKEKGPEKMEFELKKDLILLRKNHLDQMMRWNYRLQA